MEAENKKRIRRTRIEVWGARFGKDPLYVQGVIDKLGKKAALEFLQKQTGVTATPEDHAQTEIPSTNAGYEVIPLDDENATPETQSNSQIDAESLALKISQRVAQQVLTTVYADLEDRTNHILNQAKAFASSRQVAIAIKVNTDALVKLTSEAHPALPNIIGFLKVGLNPLLVGPAGCGKSYAGHQAAEAMGLPFGHICFTAGVSETWLFGRQTPTGFIEGEFSKLYRNGGVFLADEIDAADANVLLALNTALANGHLYNPISGQNIPRHKDFHFIATANTFGKGGNAVYTGRVRLDAATLDRFTIILVGYSKHIEDSLCPDATLADALRLLRKKLEDRNSNEFVSYRAFGTAYKLKIGMGFSFENIIQTLTASWPKDLVAELTSGGAL